MSDQNVVVGRIGLEQTYEELLTDLKSLVHDLFEGGLSGESFFIDNVILRLEVWALDINIQGGCLVTINKIGPLATRMQSQLDDIRSLIKDAKTSSSQKQFLAENKSHVLELLDSLAMFVEPIKTIRAQSSKDREDHTSKINAFLKTTHFSQWMREPDWFLLETPVGMAALDRLLGAVVANARMPLESLLSCGSLMQLGIKDSISDTVSRDFLMTKSLSESVFPQSW